METAILGIFRVLSESFQIFIISSFARTYSCLHGTGSLARYLFPVKSSRAGLVADPLFCMSTQLARCDVINAMPCRSHDA